MLTMLMDEALHLAGEESDNVNMEGLKAIYQMLWDNPQKDKREKFREKMRGYKSDPMRGAQNALAHIMKLADLIGVDIVFMSQTRGSGDKAREDQGWEVQGRRGKSKEKKKEQEKEKEANKKKETTERRRRKENRRAQRAGRGKEEEETRRRRTHRGRRVALKQQNGTHLSCHRRRWSQTAVVWPCVPGKPF